MTSFGTISAIVAASLGVALSSSGGGTYRPSTEEREHFESEKPLTKRQKRRQRGKSKK